MNRPTALLVVAWLWIMMGIFTSAPVGAMALSIALVQIETAMFGYYLILLMIVTFLVGMFCIIAGFYLLKLRAWARTSLEVLSWLYSILIVCDLILWLRGFTFLEDEDRGSLGAEIISTAIWAAVFAACIIFLRKKSVREAVKRKDIIPPVTV